MFLALDPYLQRAGVGQEIESLLAGASLTVVPFTEIEPDPSCFQADRAAALAREERCDLVVAVGGGSALDFGKGVAVVAGNPGTAWQHTRRKDHTPLVPGPGTLPVIALPATAGTGSEMTHYAVFSNPTLREKSTIVSERIIPKAALVDPELTYSCPPQLTALTGVDVLAHSIEAFINVNSTPFARLVSLEAIRLVGAWLPRAVAGGSDREARQHMAWASALGGIAIAHANPTLPHALGQAAGGFVHAPHGASVAACLAAVMKISHEAAPQDFAAIAAALDPEGAAGLPLGQRAARAAAPGGGAAEADRGTGAFRRAGLEGRGPRTGDPDRPDRLRHRHQPAPEEGRAGRHPGDLQELPVRIIDVDLGDRSVRGQEAPEELARLGGRALTSTLIQRETDPLCHPLAPENMLVIAPGLLAGTGLSSANRLSAGAKSPLTGGIKESNSGGTAAFKLARLGIRALKIRGAAPRGACVGLHVSREGVRFEDLGFAAGLGTYAAADALRGRYGEKVGLILAGPAGRCG